jgi:hypothetical protein
MRLRCKMQDNGFKEMTIKECRKLFKCDILCTNCP